MRRIDFIIFFSIVLTIYGLINFYIYRKGFSVLPDVGWIKITYVVGFVALASAFIVGRIVERIAVCWLSATLTWVGSLWLGVMVYYLLFLLVIDGVRLVNAIVPFFPAAITSNPLRAGQVTAVALSVVVAGIVVYGFFNAAHPRIRRLELYSEKRGASVDSLSIVAVSDIHLGTIVSNSRLQRIVSLINGIDPDLVLFPGDMLDEDLKPVLERNTGEVLRTVRAKYGVFGITGNHEYIGGVEPAVRYLEEHGITMLRDSACELACGVILAGREDRSIRQFAGRQRRSLPDILNGIDRTRPVIVMDHQPLRLEEAQSMSVDLQLSGHTHNGQLWPFNYIADAVYEISWGYLKKESTHYYVSSGAGTWGPPVRTGNYPEIVHITLRFNTHSASTGTL